MSMVSTLGTMMRTPPARPAPPTTFEPRWPGRCSSVEGHARGEVLDALGELAEAVLVDIGVGENDLAQRDARFRSAAQRHLLQRAQQHDVAHAVGEEVKARVGHLLGRDVEELDQVVDGDVGAVAVVDIAQQLCLRWPAEEQAGAGEVEIEGDLGDALSALSKSTL